MADRLTGDRIGVIGAGYAGCAAAVALTQAGHPVCLMESSRLPGGRARRVDSPHGPLDNGQHILAGAYRATLHLMETVGAVPDQLLLRLPLTLDFPGEMALRAPRLPAPLHLALALARARGLSWKERWHAARFMATLRRDGFEVAPDTNVEHLLNRHRQPERLRRILWNPLCLAALNTPPDIASARVFARVLGDTLGGDSRDSDLLLPRTDLSALLPEPACTWLRDKGQAVRLSCPVRRIQPTDTGYAVEGDGWQESFTRLVLAVAPYHALRLLPRLDATGAAHEALAGLHHQAIATCTLAYETAPRLPGPMLALGGGPGEWLFDRSALIGGPQARFAVVTSAPAEPLDTARLPSQVHCQIEQVLGPLPSPAWHQVIIEKRATFSCTAGLARPGMHSGLPGLMLAGDYVDSPYPGTLESAVRSGLAAAQGLLRAP